MTNYIFQYTRAMAIADGVLVDVSHMAKEAGYKYPVAMTQTAFLKCVKVPESLEGEQDEDGRLWDVLWMSRFRKIVPGSEGTTATFEVLVQTRPNSEPELVTLKAICGPGDTAEPVVTMMMPWED
jgi:hypothetical protein